MNRKRFLVTWAAVAFAAVMVCSSRAADLSQQPNIVIIMTDQQSGDAMSCEIGDEYLRTPSMDRLAASGMRFTRAYCANPLCVPSRTSMFTGRYPHETGIQTNGKNPVDPSVFPCLGTIFKNAGYDTGYVGKWHLPFRSKDNAAHGFAFMANLRGNGGDHASPAAAAEFLGKPRTKPFLLVVSFINPHNICEWARGQELPDGPIGAPPALSLCPPLRANHLPPRNEPDIISHVRKSYQSSRTFPVSNFGEKKWREYAWAYYRMIEMVDAHIGAVLGALGDTGQAPNTLVVFTSDHGDCQGAHRWNQKTVFYDESSRVPLIIQGPGVVRAGTSDRLVHAGVDVLPTLCDYAGIPIPTSLPGLSLRATAGGDTATGPRQFIVISNKMVQGEAIDGVKPEPEGRMLRGRRFKYSVFDLGQQRESLIDMQRDPGEMVNLARDPQYRTTLQRHRQLLANWCRENRDDFARHIPTRAE